MTPIKLESQAVILHPNSTSIPLDRYSYANSAKGTTKHQWIHYHTRDNLFLVFRPVRESADGEYKTGMKMAVCAGAKILMDQDIGHMIEVISKFERLRSLGQVGGVDESPVRVVAQFPNIAVRLPTISKTAVVPRIQMLFKNSMDYRTAIDTYEKLQLPIDHRVKCASSGAIQPVASLCPNETGQQVLRSAGIPLTFHPEVENSSQNFQNSSRAPSLLSRPSTAPGYNASGPPATSSEFMRPSSAGSAAGFNETQPTDRVFTQSSSLLKQTLLRTSSAASMHHSSPVSMTTSHERQFDPFQSEPTPHAPLPSSSFEMRETVFMHERKQDEDRICDASPSRSQSSPAPITPTPTPTSNRFRIGYAGSTDATDSSMLMPVSQAFNESRLPELCSTTQNANTSLYSTKVPFTRPQLPSGSENMPRKLLVDGLLLGDANTSPYFKSTTSSRDPTSLGRRSMASENVSPLADGDKLDYASFGSISTDSVRSISVPAEVRDSTSRLMPPRRDLPFPVKQISRPATANPMSRHVAKPSVNASDNSKSSTSTSVTTVDSNKAEAESTPAERNAKRATKPKAPAKEAVTEAEESIRTNRGDEISPLTPENTEIERPSSAPTVQLKTAAGRKRNAGATVQSKKPSKRPKMIDQSTQTQTFSGRDHTAAIDVSSNNSRSSPSAVSDEMCRISSEVEPSSEVPQQPASMPIDFIAQIEAAVSVHNAQAHSRPQELWERPGYSEASPEERQAIINDFICENLENEDFIQLCEDTGEVWRRIGLEFS